MASDILTRAVAKAQALPKEDQERIGHELSAYVDDLQTLRAELAAGIRSLDAGLGGNVDIEDVIKRARAQHERS
jgi:hypothetical protein